MKNETHSQQRAFTKAFMLVLLAMTGYLALSRSRSGGSLLASLVSLFLTKLTNLNPVKAESLSTAVSPMRRHLLETPGTHFQINPNSDLLTQRNIKFLPVLTSTQQQWALYYSQRNSNPINVALALQRLDAEANKVGNELVVTQGRTPNLDYSHCLVNSAGQVRVVFADLEGSDFKVYARDYSEAGAPLTNTTVIKEASLNQLSTPVCAGNLVVWAEEISGISKLFSTCKINGDWQAATSLADFPNSFQTHPTITASLDLSQYVIAFASNHTGASKIYGQVVDSTCQAQSSVLQISTSDASVPHIITLDTQEYLATYLYLNGQRLMAQGLTAGLQPLREEATLSTEAGNHYTVAPTTAGGYAIAYERLESLYLGYFDKTNTALLRPFNIDTGGNAYDPRVAFLQNPSRQDLTYGGVLMGYDNRENVFGYFHDAQPQMTVTAPSVLKLASTQAQVQLNQDKVLQDPDHYRLAEITVQSSEPTDKFELSSLPSSNLSVSGSGSSSVTISGDAHVSSYLQAINSIVYFPNQGIPGFHYLSYFLTDPLNALGFTQYVADVGAIVHVWPPTLTVTPAVGEEDNWAPLNITTALVNPEMDVLTIKISNLPTGASLHYSNTSDLIAVNNHAALLTPNQLNDLEVKLAADVSGPYELTVEAIATDTPTSEFASTIKTLPLDIIPVVDPLTLAVNSTTGKEDQPIPLSINAYSPDQDGSELIQVELHDLPITASLSQGNRINTVWHLTPHQLVNLQLIPEKDFSGFYPLGVRATATETLNGDSTTQQANFTVTVEPVADPPLLTAQPLVVRSGDEIDLNIHAQVTDQDGSERLSNLTLFNLPAGAELAQGLALNETTWSIDPSVTPQRVNLPKGLSGTFELSALVRSIELANLDEASSQVSFLLAILPSNSTFSVPNAEYAIMENDPIGLIRQNLVSLAYPKYSGSLYELTQVNGADTDFLTYPYASLTWFNNGTVIYQLDQSSVMSLKENQLAQTLLNFTVSNQEGDAATGNLRFNITGVNTPPLLVRGGVETRRLELKDSFFVEVDHFKDPEGDTWKLEIDNTTAETIPPWLRINPAEHSLYGIAETPGEYSLSLRARDINNAVSTAFLLNLFVQSPVAEPSQVKSDNLMKLVIGLGVTVGSTGLCLLLAVLCRRQTNLKLLAEKPYAAVVHQNLSISLLASKTTTLIFIKLIDEALANLNANKIAVPRECSDNKVQFTHIAWSLAEAFRHTLKEKHGHIFTTLTRKHIHEVNNEHKETFKHFVLKLLIAQRKLSTSPLYPLNPNPSLSEIREEYEKEEEKDKVKVILQQPYEEPFDPVFSPQQPNDKDDPQEMQFPSMGSLYEEPPEIELTVPPSAEPSLITIEPETVIEEDPEDKKEEAGEMSSNETGGENSISLHSDSNPNPGELVDGFPVSQRTSQAANLGDQDTHISDSDSEDEDTEDTFDYSGLEGVQETNTDEPEEGTLATETPYSPSSGSSGFFQPGAVPQAEEKESPRSKKEAPKENNNSDSDQDDPAEPETGSPSAKC